MAMRGFRQAGRLAANARAPTLRAPRLPMPVRSMAGGPVEDNRQIGDWPMMPDVSSQRRDPFLYDDIQDRRNFGETMHEQDEALSMWMVDESAAADRLTLEEMTKQLLMMLGLLVGVGWLASKLKYDNPVNPKAFPAADAVMPDGDSHQKWKLAQAE